MRYLQMYQGNMQRLFVTIFVDRFGLAFVLDYKKNKITFYAKVQRMFPLVFVIRFRY